MTAPAPRPSGAPAGAFPRGEQLAGVLLWQAGPAAAAVVAAVALTAGLLLPLHLWRPVVALPVGLVLAAAAVRFAVPGPVRPAPRWSTALCVLTAAGHGVWAALTCAQHLVLRRDAGSYANYAHWIATHHGLPVDARLDAFGGPDALRDPAFTLASPAFYQVVHTGAGGVPTGADVVPQFLPGAPAWYSLGWWAGGWHGLLVVPALLGALAVLAVAGLAARVVGPRWAPLAAAAVAGCAPVLHTSRSTYSEPAALLLVVAAASLLTDAAGAVSRGTDAAGAVSRATPADAADGAGTAALARRCAWGAGLLFGLAGLVRVDALREVVLLFPVVALLAVRRHPAAAPLLRGTLLGTAVSAAVALGLSRPYLGSIAGSLLPLVALGAVLAVGSVAAVWRARHRPGPGFLAGKPAPAFGIAVAAVALLLASRPLWTVSRQDPADPGSRVVAGLQAAHGLNVDGGRTYAEHSLVWTAWWVGWPAVVLAFAALAGAAVAAVRRWRAPVEDPRAGLAPWLPVALVGLASTVLTLLRPGITPDHPWADRRLVTVVLPVVVLAATAAVAEITRAARRRVPATALALVGVAGVAALLVPTVLATAPLAGQRTEQGELDAVRSVCRALQPGDAVLTLDSRASNEWPQVVRGVCGVPAAVVRNREGALSRTVPPIAERVRRAGYRPVLLATSPQPLGTLGLGVDPTVAVMTTEDQRELVTRPDGSQSLDVEVWLVPWQPPGR